MSNKIQNESYITVNSKLIRATLISTFLLIILGSTIRINHAGLSCPDWPLCYSLFLPTYSKISILEDQIGYHYSQLILEWAHRVIAALIVGPCICLLVIQSFYRSYKVLKLGHNIFIETISFSFCLLILLTSQVFLGNFTVLEQNIPWSVALHLCAAIVLYQLLIYYYVYWSGKITLNSKLNRLFIFIAYNIAILTMISGVLQGVLDACSITSIQDIWLAWENPLLAISLTHYISTALLLVICIVLKIKEAPYSNIALALLVAECILGLLRYNINHEIIALVHQSISLVLYTIISILFWISVRIQDPK